MKEQMRKIETIRSIEQLQLSNTLISALDNVNTADTVMNAVDELIRFNQQWY